MSRNPVPAARRQSTVLRLKVLLALFTRTGPLLALLTVVGTVLVERSVTGVLAGLAGAVLGTLVALAALQLGMLAGALAFGARVHNVVIGVGRRWAEWITPRRTVALRGLPVLLSVSVGPGRPPRRLRMWAAGLVSTLVGAAVPALAWLLAGSEHTSALWRGMALGATAIVLHSLIPRQSASSTSTGWMLFGLPRMSPDQIADLEASALADEALSAVNAGDLATADTVTAELAARYPGARATGTTRVALLEAHGRYAEALSAALNLASAPQQTERDAAFMLAGLAGLAATAVEAGQVPAEAALPTAHQALDSAVQLGYPSYKLDGTRALLALLDGDAAAAARLARSAADLTDHALSRADDLATLARAMMASGDNRGAREALAEAETLAPWWPRVTTTRTRLDL